MRSALVLQVSPGFAIGVLDTCNTYVELGYYNGFLLITVSMVVLFCSSKNHVVTIGVIKF